MTTDEFIHHCRSEIEKSYQNTKSRKPDNTHKYRTEGLLHAARLLEIMTKADIQNMVEEEHLKVFGVSVDERKKKASKLAKLKESSPDDYFDIPAIERK